MNSIRELIRTSFPVILLLVVALSAVLLVSMMIPILVPVCVFGILILIAWLWFNGGAAPRRNSKRDYPEDFQ
jgi:ABC-type multidrug transport system permease subunit